jgi:Fe-Mn family superoxide dismutase
MEKLIELKFEANEFDGVINAETIETHHGKHLNTYVTNYNNLVEGTEYADMALTEVLKDTSSLAQGIINNGGGVYNHNIYFEQLGRNALVDGELKDLIISTFGSVEKLEEELLNAGLTQFGSGWSWLVIKDNALSVIKTANQDSPISEGYTVLVAVDVWEHAYYLDYKNLRADYIKKLFSIIDWEVVNARFLNR